MSNAEASPFSEYAEILADFEDILSVNYRRPRPAAEIKVVRAAGSSGEAAADGPHTEAARRREAAGRPQGEAGGSGILLSGESREARERLLEAVAEEVRTCSKCGLAGGRTKAVPGIGAADPLVMVIGEGPGAEEDRTGIPFVGPAGQYLDKWLEAVGLFRDKNAFIANIVKCRPPGNRDPLPEESAACLPYLERQIALVRPKVVLAVGRIAAQNLLGTTRGIGALRGRKLEWRGLPLVATYHPSAVLRDISLKRPVWEDLKLLKDVFEGRA